MSPKEIEKAVYHLKKGKMLVFPTETCYGLGVNAENERAVLKMYYTKNRNAQQPTHILVSGIEMAEKYVKFTEKTKRLARSFPSRLTIILPIRKDVPESIRFISLNSTFLGFRIASDPISSTLVKKLGKPITATSANKKNHLSPFSVEESMEQMDYNEEILFLDGGNLPKGRLSTIVIVEGKEISLLREGAIPFWKIKFFGR